MADEPQFKPVDPAQYPNHWLDVPYAQVDPRQVLDIWLPDEGEGPFPVLLFIHGGNWIAGDKRENTMPGVFKVMSQGYALVCIEYRLAPACRWPAPLYDVRTAIRYIRAHADEYRLDASRIAIMGNSKNWATPSSMIRSNASSACIPRRISCRWMKMAGLPSAVSRR